MRQYHASAPGGRYHCPECFHSTPQPSRSYPNFFSSARSFSLPAGTQFGPEGVRGYYIDLRVKAEEPSGRTSRSAGWRIASGCACTSGAWAPTSATSPARATQWLQNAIDVGEYALSQQVAGGERDGLWLNRLPYTKTFQLAAGWPSAMAQGEGASLLMRLYLETRDERCAAAARRAVRAMSIPSDAGGVQATLDGSPWPEEYPTAPPSLRAERRHLRALGLLRRGGGAWATMTRRRVREAPACSLTT